jgi:hypothetical protein
MGPLLILSLLTFGESLFATIIVHSCLICVANWKTQQVLLTPCPRLGARVEIVTAHSGVPTTSPTLEKSARLPPPKKGDLAMNAAGSKPPLAKSYATAPALIPTPTTIIVERVATP